MRPKLLWPAAIATLLMAAGIGLVRSAEPATRPLRFAEADVFVEINGTDGDAGLQLVLDGEPWRTFELLDPTRRQVFEVETGSALEGYGLTGLGFESAEPPFDRQPLSRFAARFPAGVYRFRGTTVTGRALVGADRLTHVFPREPVVTSPREAAVVARDGFAVTWLAVTKPTGVRIVGYEVIVTNDESGRTFDVRLPATARRLTVPSEFLAPRTDHAVEVLAREASGNQTITEVAFRTR